MTIIQFPQNPLNELLLDADALKLLRLEDHRLAHVRLRDATRDDLEEKRQLFEGAIAVLAKKIKLREAEMKKGRRS
jgi:hypothetical protein